MPSKWTQAQRETFYAKLAQASQQVRLRREILPLLALTAPQTCLCYPDGGPEIDGARYDGCVCVDSERACRAYAYHPELALPPMTPAQREECLAEIGRVEGYSQNDYAESTDQELARGVLQAWLDYCRDKGLV